MSITQIQQEVRSLSQAERRKLTTWMVSEFPVLRVDDLVSRAAASVQEGQWHPQPPDDENTPSEKMREHAIAVARRLGLHR